MTNSNHLTHGFHQASGGGASPEEQDPTTGIEPTVRLSHGLACRACGSDTKFFVTGHVCMEVLPWCHTPFGRYGLREDGFVRCMTCYHKGTVSEFRLMERDDTPIDE